MMNLLVVFPENRSSEGSYIITGKDFLHLKNVLKVKVGQKVFAGELSGLMGYLEVIAIDEDSTTINGTFDISPPTAAPIKLILAMPRPKMLKRILRSVSMLGVKEIYLINTYKVEKSFWQTQLLENKVYEDYLLEGLRQSKDTVMPTLHIKKRFKPFVEDELGEIIKGTTALVAHPGNYPEFPQGIADPMTLVIGPEGGFTEYEIGMLESSGLKTVQCGPRILRMETAVVSLISQHKSFIYGT